MQIWVVLDLSLFYVSFFFFKYIFHSITMNIYRLQVYSWCRNCSCIGQLALGTSCNTIIRHYCCANDLFDTRTRTWTTWRNTSFGGDIIQRGFNWFVVRTLVRVHISLVIIEIQINLDEFFFFLQIFPKINRLCYQHLVLHALHL